MDSEIRVFVDMRCLQDRNYAFRGVGLHSAGILRHVRSSLTRPCEVIGVVDDELDPLPEEYAKLVDRIQSHAGHGFSIGETVFVQLSPMTHEQIRMAPLLGRRNVFACCAIYDFIPYPDMGQSDEPPRGYISQLASLKLYNLFLSISAHSANRLQECVGVNAETVSVTGACLRNAFVQFRKSDPVETRRQESRHEYFVVVGGGHPRKNIECAVEALGLMIKRTKRGPRLCIVGNYREPERKRLTALLRSHGGRKNDIMYVDGISDEELCKLYHGAVAVICPSRDEGFSLPVVEAVACSAPVVASSCEAQRELIPDEDALFHPDDCSRLSRLMQELLERPESRERLCKQQQSIAQKFDEREVATRFWNRVEADFDEWSRKRRSIFKRQTPRIAILSPFPPQRSGVADYTAHSIRSLAKHATIDVFTETKPEPTSGHGVRNFYPLSQYPYVFDEYDKVLSVIGNSHFHTRIIEYQCRFGGPSLIHDNRLADLYAAWRGPKKFAEMASRSLGKPVSIEESQRWLDNPGELPSLFFDEIVPSAEPLILHSRGIQQHVAVQYGKSSAYLPFCCYRYFLDEELSDAARIQAKRRLGLAEDRIAIVTFGYVHDVKAPFECVWALEQLAAWGIQADLHFVGDSPAEMTQQIRELSGRLGIGDRVHMLQKWGSDSEYRDYLVAGDYGIQLRTHGFGGLSGALLDCISAGLPTVANQDLAQAMEGPDFVLPVPDMLSPTLMAEAIANAVDSDRHLIRVSLERDDYLAEHNFDNYSEQMMKVLSLN